MLRQPLQRMYGMQASDIDIYRNITREKTKTMVRYRREGYWEDFFSLALYMHKIYVMLPGKVSGLSHEEDRGSNHGGLCEAKVF